MPGLKVDLSLEMERTGAFVPVQVGVDDERLWLDCDLASLAENRLGDRLDPRDLDPARREQWIQRALLDRGHLRPGVVSDLERCYWILDGTARAGTIALATSTLGTTRLYVSSVYIFPDRRSTGIARHAFTLLKGVLAARGLGMRLDTYWTWQQAVRFYLRGGMWVYMWRRSPAFIWQPDLPEHEIRVDADEATLRVPVGGQTKCLARARRRGERLEFDEFSDATAGSASFYASSTLALAIATRGWPLIRSRQEFERNRDADAGPPEALAYKIGVWEAWDARHGWLVSTPRIPGIGYPSWEELERRDREEEP